MKHCLGHRACALGATKLRGEPSGPTSGSAALKKKRVEQGRAHNKLRRGVFVSTAAIQIQEESGPALILFEDTRHVTLALPEPTGAGVKSSLVSPNRKGARPPSPASPAPADVVPMGAPGPSSRWGELLPSFPSPAQSPSQSPLAVTSCSLLQRTNESCYYFLVFKV